MSNPGDIVSAREVEERVNRQMVEVVDSVNQNFASVMRETQDGFNRVQKTVDALNERIQQLEIEAGIVVTDE